MNGAMLGHWGLITWPDDEWLQNVLVNEDGSIEQFEPGYSLRVISITQPWRPRPKLVTVDQAADHIVDVRVLKDDAQRGRQ